MAYNFVLYPLLTWAWLLSGMSLEDMPPLADTSELYPIILGMLGIGGMRSYDKKQGTNTKRMA